MSSKQIRYYKWDKTFFDLEYDLGSPLSLIDNNDNFEKIINEESGETEYIGKSGVPNRITLKNNKVHVIWLSARKELPKNNDLFNLDIKELEPKLNEILHPLNDKIKNHEDLFEYKENDVLMVIFRDFFVTLIGILKKIDE